MPSTSFCIQEKILQSATGSRVLAGRVSKHPAQIKYQILLTAPTDFQLQSFQLRAQVSITYQHGHRITRPSLILHLIIKSHKLFWTLWLLEKSTIVLPVPIIPPTQNSHSAREGRQDHRCTSYILKLINKNYQYDCREVRKERKGTKQCCVSCGQPKRVWQPWCCHTIVSLTKYHQTITFIMNCMTSHTNFHFISSQQWVYISIY